MKKPMNQHHYLENVTMALNAMKKDDIKLVNIGMYKFAFLHCKYDCNIVLFLLLLMRCLVDFLAEGQLQLHPINV